MIRLAISAALLITTASLGVTTHGEAAPIASEVVGRTLTCTTGYQGGARVKGRIAVTTTSGRPIAYAEVTEAAGKSSLFTSKGCL